MSYKQNLHAVSMPKVLDPRVVVDPPEGLFA